MKKKELISKIDSLITSLNEMNAELKACREENAGLKLRIEELSKASEELKETPKTEPIVEPQIQPEAIVEKVIDENEQADEISDLPEETEEKDEPLTSVEPKTEPTDKKVLNILPIGEKVILPDSIMEFGAEIIGKIVIESAKYADLVAASTTLNKKELLNLIMGKSEVCKAEILGVVTSDAETDTKITLINAQLSEAVDYFKSVVAQI